MQVRVRERERFELEIIHQTVAEFSGEMIL